MIETAAVLLSPCLSYYPLILKHANNPMREAAQTYQESTCNRLAKSPYAEGLRQFTPSTGKWAAKTFCRHLGSYRPFDAEWSLRCGIIYQEWLEASTKKKFPIANYCEIRKIAEQRYNGGGWVLKEIYKANTIDLNVSKRFCTRASWACKENYGYPKYITKRQEVFKPLGGIPCY